MTMHINNAWVVEYSPSQNTVHIDTVGNTIQRNMRNLQRGTGNDYMLIGVHDTEESAHKYAQKVGEDNYASLVSYTGQLATVGSIIQDESFRMRQADYSAHYAKPDPVSVVNFDRTDYSVVQGKALMELTDEDLERINLHQPLVKPDDYPTIYYCRQPQNWSKIYFTPETDHYVMRGHMLVEIGQIRTTEELVCEVKKWLDPAHITPLN